MGKLSETIADTTTYPMNERSIKNRKQLWKNRYMSGRFCQTGKDL